LSSFALCYHAVSERWPATLSVTPTQLADQVSMLAGRGYRGVTLSEAVVHPAAPRTVAITFDDAYRSVIELAFPILSEAGFVASVFAPTSYIGQEGAMSWPGIGDWLHSEYRHELNPLSWEELARLADAGWEVGSHGRSHARLTDLDQPALDAELGESRAEIERQLSRSCRSLAYPYGERDQRVVASARRAGYTVAASLGHDWPSPQTERLDWPRTFVNHIDGPLRFRLKVSPLTRRLMASPAWGVVASIRRRVRG